MFITCMNDAARQDFGADVKELSILLRGTDIGKAFQLLVNLIDIIEELCTEGTQLNKGNYMLNPISILIYCFFYLFF